MVMLFIASQRVFFMNTHGRDYILCKDTGFPSLRARFHNGVTLARGSAGASRRVRGPKTSGERCRTAAWLAAQPGRYAGTQLLLVHPYCSNTARQASLRLAFCRRRQLVMARTLGISAAQRR